MRRLLPGVGLIAVIACGHGSNDDPTANERIGATRQDLIAAPEKYTGADLADHELALTFDDGPGAMDVTGALAQWLHDHKDPKTGAPAPIQATFFVIGDCIKETPLSAVHPTCDRSANPDAVLAKVVSLGHYIGNHTATHRALTDIPNAEIPKELAETDALISKYLIWNRSFFRAPTGAWDTNVFNQLKGTAMNKYAGPVYWSIGGGAGSPPVTADLAADWACFEGPNGDGTGKRYSTKQCGDIYIKEIRAVGNKGIVLMHDAKGSAPDGNLAKIPGNTVDMVKYIVGELEKDAKPWKWKRLDEVPSLAAVLPKCDASCETCSGPTADKCLTCAADKHLEAGACVAGPPPGDAGTDAEADAGSGSSSSSSSGEPLTSSSSSSSTSSSGDPTPAADAAGDDGGGGCRTTRGTGGMAMAGLLGLVMAASALTRRRRR